ncbi:hypothetical protein MYCTH_2308036 [Thermothelomyces thermophilus ATCC 42464]|uniref:Carboxylic ester hydrolase n=1 Tax=Thermothelomyces thermophilus (strain ATCC 42464 / BCRC 31852 / DSM 1799) TaxID=573729 RepID=G2QJ33_THET4|nr:uncharacterized protein MYCTH_2308036 [Thermothelomyces thermophilus ATCC 42464]AEO59608.1 hypothetical protein MYCTH_2308036 [Thermothelomyces thermophilus ATCC 42464]
MAIMAVTLNYGVGFLGFPGGTEVAAAGVTNLGLKDQRQALRWIQENIAAFGGDLDKVTVWGQSAGANSIAYQLLAYGAKTDEKLFRGAIMSSGSIGIGNAVHPDREDAVQGYRAVLNATNCLDAEDALGCLRAVPLDEVFEAGEATGTHPTWWPTVDGDFIPQPPSLQLEAGEFLVTCPSSQGPTTTKLKRFVLADIDPHPDAVPGAAGIRESCCGPPLLWPLSSFIATMLSPRLHRLLPVLLGRHPA